MSTEVLVLLCSRISFPSLQLLDPGHMKALRRCGAAHEGVASAFLPRRRTNRVKP